jgi:hypothetical protein
VSRHAADAYLNNNHFSCLPCVERLTLATIFSQICKSTSSMTSTLGTVNEATEITTEATVHNFPEEEERLRTIQEDKGLKVPKDRSKRTGPKGRLWTVTRQERCRPILSSSTRRSNALIKSMRTRPRERLLHRLLSRAGSQPALRLTQAKDMEATSVHATFTGRTPNTTRCHGASSGEATPTTAPLYDFRRWESHMSLPYGHQPSSPYR